MKTKTSLIIEELQRLRNNKGLEGMKKFGINPGKALGIGIPLLRSLAVKYGKDHALALSLWESGIHEARILASYVDDSSEVTEIQLENWVKDFDSWDVCDQCCGNLFVRTPFAFSMAKTWSKRKPEFIKRAGFVMLAELAVHAKNTSDEAFIPFFAMIEREAWDERNFVKKAVNWALRQIGKRSIFLHSHAVKCALKISQQSSPAAQWIAGDALRELNSAKVIERLNKKALKQ